MVSLLEADPAQVSRGGGVQVAPEGELDGAGGDADRAGDVGDGDVGVGLDEADGPPGYPYQAVRNRS
jgi:hypothetical protein